MSRNLGIPVKLLHESSGHTVTVELKSGELYRGSMIECEDNWNCQLENITYTAKVMFCFVDFIVSFSLTYFFNPRFCFSFIADVGAVKILDLARIEDSEI